MRKPTNLHKYPSTPHVPFSPGVSRDDSMLKSLAHFEGQEVSITLKRDGENTSLYSSYFHARSLDGRHHPSRDWLKRFHATFAHDIPEGWRICGENLYARHSIAYDALPSYFMGFSVWDETNTALAVQESFDFMELLGITPVPEVYRGVFSEKKLKEIVKELDTNVEEGIVMRLTRRIHYDEFENCFTKWVRKGHVQTDKHWMHAEIIPNGLA